MYCAVYYIADVFNFFYIVPIIVFAPLLWPALTSIIVIFSRFETMNNNRLTPFDRNTTDSHSKSYWASWWNVVTHSDTDNMEPLSPSWWRAVVQTSEWKLLYYPVKMSAPFLLLLGGFGNVASVVILHRTKSNDFSQHVFLMVLAVADLCVLQKKLVFAKVHQLYSPLHDGFKNRKN